MHTIILSGGVGSRLWPVSRDLHPKPFMKMSDGESFLQKVYNRTLSLPSVKSMTTVTNETFLFKTKDEYNKATINKTNNIDVSYIVEPFGKNTAPAIAFAALDISRKYGENEIILLLPSDHIINDQNALIDAVSKAETLADIGKIVTFGITPQSPETGYGYIEFNGYDVIRFVEKPTFEKAKSYLESKNYLWNSGMFCFSCKTILEEMEKYCPEILEQTRKCFEKSLVKNASDNQLIKVDPTTFEKVPEESIDYAVLEKTQKAAVVPCDLGWSDIGTWSAMSEIMESDTNGNVTKGEIITHNVNNCYVESNHRVVGVVGVENLIIVDTEDALLVTDKSKSQNVKDIYSKLRKMGHETHKHHRMVHRPWGTYTVLEEGLGFKIKRIEVYPGASLSLQMHNHRAEHWVVVAGVAQVINGNEELTLEVNQSTFIPIGNKHRLSNLGSDKLVMIEVQTGSYLGEDDIVRFEDIYGRTTDAA